MVTGSPGGGNLRAHVANAQNFQGVIQGAIKVATANPNQAQQQAILTALNPGQRSNASPVRLQTSGGSLVAVTVQQSGTQGGPGSVAGSSGTDSGQQTTNINQGTQQSQNQQGSQVVGTQQQGSTGAVNQGQQQVRK